MPEAPLTPEDPARAAADDGSPELGLGASEPAGPADEIRQFARRFADGLSRQHGWRVVAARLVIFAIALGIVLFILAEFVKST